MQYIKGEIIMKVEINDNNMNAEIGSNKTISSNSPNIEVIKQFNLETPIIFGIVAFITSVINLLIGLFVNFGTKTITGIIGEIPYYLVAVLVVFMVIMIVLSVIFGVFSVVFFAKSKKKTMDIMGFILAILSFVTTCTGAIFSVLGVVVW